MYNASSGFKTAQNQYSRTFHAKIEVDGSVITSGIKQIKCTASSNANDSLVFGGAVSSYLDISLAPPSIVLENKEIAVSIGLEVNGAIEYVPFGLFTVTKPEVESDLVKITAYDRMVSKCSKGYFSDLSFPSDTVKVLNEICSKIGVNLGTSGLSAITIEKKPEGYTYREVISYIAGLYGRFANFDRVGNLVFNWYGTPQTLDVSMVDNPTWTAEHSYSLNKIEVAVDSDTTLTVGSGATCMQFSNPLMTQSALSNIWNSRKNYTYRGGNINLRLGNVLLDPWDCVSIGGYSIPCMTVETTYDGGVSTKITAEQSSDTEREIDFSGPTVEKLDRQYTELLLVKDVLAQKVDTDVLTANYALIKDLDVTNANIGTLNAQLGNFQTLTTENFKATNGQITTLSGDYANYKVIVSNQFSTVNADIGTANIDLANIKSVLAGNIGTGTLQTMHMTAQNTVIDDAVIKSAMIDTLDFGKLTGIDINTTNLRVHSNDGKSQWTDNTIQISDANRVRVQIGKDASNDYSMYVWDKSGKLMFDALGLTDNGIQREIIRNDMVSETANISGSKLDIASVIQNINNDGTTTLNTSKIKFDETGQTLDVAFDSLNTKVDGNVQTVNNLNTQMSVVQGAITSKVWESDITEALDDVYDDVDRIDGTTKTLTDNYTTLDQTVSGLSATVASNTTAISKKADGSTVTALSNKYTTLDTTVSGISAKVSSNTAEISKKADGTTVTELSTKVTSVTTDLSGFKTTVAQTYTGKASIISTINQSAEKITISASKLDLVGAVTFSCFDTSLQTKVNTASSDASTAKSTANTASTNASNAVATANGAVSTANTAKSTATTASTNASSALTKAGTAITDASAALTKANSVDNTIATWCYNNNRTYIDGANIYTGTITAKQIAANSITSNKIAIGDFTNLVTVNPYNKDTMLPSTFFGGTSVGGLDNNNNLSVTKKSDTQPLLILCDYSPICFDNGDELYYEMNVGNYDTTAHNYALAMWIYDSNYGNTKALVGNKVSAPAKSWKQISGAIKIPAGHITTSHKLFVIGIDCPTKLSVSGAYCRKKSNGQLIVDGTITADKLNVTSLGAISAKIAGYTIAGNLLYGENVGMCGKNGDGWAFWSGSDVSGSNNAPFRVGHDGSFYATKATIGGNSYIGDWKINDGNLIARNDDVGFLTRLHAPKELGGFGNSQADVLVLRTGKTEADYKYPLVLSSDGTFKATKVDISGNIKIGGANNKFGAVSIFNSSGTIEGMLDYNGYKAYSAGTYVGKIGTNLYNNGTKYLATDYDPLVCCGFEVTAQGSSNVLRATETGTTINTLNGGCLSINDSGFYLGTKMAGNDWAAIGTYGAKDNGTLMFKTGDNGNEPICFEQCSGDIGNATMIRRAYVLDKDGNTSIPGDLKLQSSSSKMCKIVWNTYGGYNVGFYGGNNGANHVGMYDWGNGTDAGAGYIWRYAYGRIFEIDRYCKFNAGTNISSTEKIKTNIEPYEASNIALQTIMDTRFYKYSLKSDVKDGYLDYRNIGVIVEREIPDIFKSRDADGINLYSMVSMAMLAIKELKREIESLKNNKEVV